MAQVVITDCDFGAGEIEIPILEAHGHHVTLAQARNEDDVIDAAAHAEGIICQYAPITARVADALPHLRGVVRYGVGLDNIDLEAMANRGIPVEGNTDYCTDEVADHCVALMLASLRSIAEISAHTKAGEWPSVQDIAVLDSLTDKTVGLIGCGRIAQQVIQRLSGFRCRILAYDPYLPPEVFDELGVEQVSIERALAAPIVSLHMPLTEETFHLINHESLEAMAPGAVLVNVSRGGLIDETALKEALESGQLGAFGADVLEGEGASHPLTRAPRTTITPHLAYYSPQSLERLRREQAEKLVAMLDGGARK